MKRRKALVTGGSTGIGRATAIALDLTPLNITVNAVAPGEVATPMNDLSPEDVEHSVRPAIPVRRPGFPRETGACFRHV